MFDRFRESLSELTTIGVPVLTGGTSRLGPNWGTYGLTESHLHLSLLCTTLKVTYIRNINGTASLIPEVV